jgi:hypothetical protein
MDAQTWKTEDRRRTAGKDAWPAAAAPPTRPPDDTGATDDLAGASDLAGLGRLVMRGAHAALRQRLAKGGRS